MEAMGEKSGTGSPVEDWELDFVKEDVEELEGKLEAMRDELDKLTSEDNAGLVSRLDDLESKVSSLAASLTAHREDAQTAAALTASYIRNVKWAVLLLILAVAYLYRLAVFP